MSQMITKKYVRGSFLYSTHDGPEFEQKNNEFGEKSEVIIHDRANLVGLKKQMQQKKDQVIKKKQMNKSQKPVLIPIRDTPVEPVPQPVLQNNKCQRATQQQFEYFQSYISQKQKERQFQLEQQEKVDEFCKNQEQFRKKQGQNHLQNKRISIVLEKGEQEKKAKKKNIKIVIKKKQQKQLQPNNKNERNSEQRQDLDEFEKLSKVRVLE